VGGIVGLHWVLFFHSIKVSTVSVTLVTLSSLTLFTALLEPLFNKRKISLVELGIGLLIIYGIFLIFKFETQYMWGIIFGLSCSLCASLFSILNAQMVQKTEPSIITFYEMSAAFIWISLYMLFTGGYTAAIIPQGSDWLYLIVLGSVCTAIAYVLGVAVMKELGAFTVALATNMEPLYGIALALLIFGQRETMSTGFYSGAALVLFAVFLYPFLKKKIGTRNLQIINRKLH